MEKLPKRFQFKVNSHKEFEATLLRLFSLGYCIGAARVKTLEQLKKLKPNSYLMLRWFCFGDYKECSAQMWIRTSQGFYNYKVITADEFFKFLNDEK